MWQRRARFAIAVFAIAVLGVVLYTMRPREVRAPVAPVDRLDPKATIETRGGEVIQLKGATQDLRVEFDGQATYEDGQTKLMGVKLMVDNRAGRNFVVTGKEAHVGANQASYQMSGDVKLAASDGLTATGHQATYAQADGMVLVPGPAQFTKGRMAGAGIGFSFDEQRDIIKFDDQAVIRFAAENDLPPMDVASGTFTYARADRYIRFERGVRMVREGQIIEADEATVHLFADRDDPDLVELRGNSSVTGGTGIGSLRLLKARDINLDYDDDGKTLQQATLAGQTSVQMAAQDGSPGLQLTSEWTDVSLATDGAITSLSARDNLVVQLPPSKDAPPRTVRAVQLNGRGAAGEGLTAMTFQDNVEFRETATADRPARIARARTLEARLSAGSGALETARFTGGFRFEEGAMKATSAEAMYQIVAGTLALRGGNGAAGPNVADETLTIDGESIDLTLAPRKMQATGTVRSVLQPAPPKASATAGPLKRPGLLGDKDPVYVVADTLVYEEASHRGQYTGKARLWQGDTSIVADAITLDETRGDLTATGKVTTNLSITSEGSPAAPPGAGAGPTIAQAGGFKYSDETRRAVYDTGAHMNGSEGDLRAEHIELHLAPAENALNQLEASEAVSVRLDTRTASGQRLTHTPADGKYVITGSPVKMLEQCRETTGRTLTFFKSSDRVVVDGNEQNRTETKSGGKCPPSH